MNKFYKCMKSYLSEGVFKSLSSTESVDKFVSLLEESGYKVIACDFDTTMIKLHSGGYLDPEVDRKVLQSVTTDFKSMSQRLKNSPLRMVIVTFSDAIHVEGHPRYISGEKMVRLSLEYSNVEDKIEKVYAYYPRFWDSPNMYKKLGLDGPMPSFKEYHLKKICSDFNVKLEEIVLIDDDIHNCRNAKSLGVTALHVTGEGFKLEEVNLL